MGATLQKNPEAAMAGATPYLRLFGLAAGGIYLGARARWRRPATARPGQPIALARFFAENIATAAHGPEGHRGRRRRLHPDAGAGSAVGVSNGSPPLDGEGLPLLGGEDESGRGQMEQDPMASNVIATLHNDGADRCRQDHEAALTALSDATNSGETRKTREAGRFQREPSGTFATQAQAVAAARVGWLRDVVSSAKE